MGVIEYGSCREGGTSRGGGHGKNFEKSFEKGLTKAPVCDRIIKLSPNRGSGQLIEN